MLTRARGAAGVVGVVAGCLLLSGCGAEILPLVAVEQDTRGGFTAVLRPCGDDLITGLSLFGTHGDPEQNLSGWDTTVDRSGADARFPLFSPPAGWRAAPVGPQRVVPGYTYELAFGKAVPNYEYTGTVTFTAKNLSTLKPGQVWADGKAMSLGEFEKLAEDSC
ncbi:hypothetical protein [Streptomyces sp. NBC_00989]|uniref:hypothetical protein n=1 Tax=Streptomyces sp. NBC_00989 TaxID=2903705 RepID=UPI0038644233|nr:hypothetical protein OG714_16435 [Streptomyces sp. NBC_00989]